MIDYFKDGWNWTHLLGSCVLTIVLLKFTTWSPAIVFSFGFLWECLDECKKRYDWQIWFFDSAGFDYLDLIMDAIGITLALLIGVTHV